LQIQLSWTEPATGERRQPQLATPVAIGRTFNLMPADLNGQRVSRIVLSEAQVSDYHALIEDQNGELVVVDRGSSHGLLVNGASVPRSILHNGDRLQIGPYEIQISLAAAGAFSPGQAAAVVGGAAAAGLGGAAAMAAGSAAMGADAGTESFACYRKIGFLFKRRCTRTSPVGCPDCDGGKLGDDDDPYFYERSFYTDYGSYRRGWGSTYYRNRDRYSYNPDRRDVDFTEADAETVSSEADTDYEQDMGAS